MNRPDISRLNKNRGIYLKLGFVIALSLTVMAFNYTVYDEENEAYVVLEPEEDELLAVVRTVQKKKPLPPPPVFKLTENIVEPDVVFEPEPEPILPEVIVDPTLPERIPEPVVIPEPKPPVIFEPEPEPAAPPIFVVVEQMPRFNGCENQGLSDSDIKTCSDKKMLEFIYSNVKYPALAKENGIEGVVVASFVVEKDGSISGMKISRDIGGGCGKEVSRVVKKMPNWIAGEQRGRKVRVQFNLPVKFSLE